MKTADAIKEFGSVRLLAEAVRITQQAVHQWGDHVPEGRAFQIEVLTKGKLKAREREGAI